MLHLKSVVNNISLWKELVLITGAIQPAVLPSLMDLTAVKHGLVKFQVDCVVALTQPFS